MADFTDRRLLEHLRACPTRSAGEGRRHQAWIGVSIFGAQRCTDSNIACPGITRAQLIAIKQLQIQAESLTGFGVGAQGVHVLFAARQFEVARALVLAVDADQLAQVAPYLMRPLRQGQLRQRTALTPHAAVIDAAGVRSAKITFQQGDPLTLQGQRQGCRGADNAAADDNRIGFNQCAHGCVSTDCFSMGCIPRPKGSGLIGAWPRRRPTCSTDRPLSRAMISAAARPHIRP